MDFEIFQFQNFLGTLKKITIKKYNREISFSFWFHSYVNKL